MEELKDVLIEGVWHPVVAYAPATEGASNEPRWLIADHLRGNLDALENFRWVSIDEVQQAVVNRPGLQTTGPADGQYIEEWLQA